MQEMRFRAFISYRHLSPDQEIALLGTVPLDREAVIGKDFSDRTAGLPDGVETPEEAAPAQIASSDRPEEGLPENDVIALTEYAPKSIFTNGRFTRSTCLTIMFICSFRRLAKLTA